MTRKRSTRAAAVSANSKISVNLDQLQRWDDNGVELTKKPKPSSETTRLDDTKTTAEHPKVNPNVEKNTQPKWEIFNDYSDDQQHASFLNDHITLEDRRAYQTRRQQLERPTSKTKKLSRYFRYPRDPELSPLRPYRFPTEWPDCEVIFVKRHHSMESVDVSRFLSVSPTRSLDLMPTFS